MWVEGYRLSFLNSTKLCKILFHCQRYNLMPNFSDGDEGFSLSQPQLDSAAARSFAQIPYLECSRACLTCAVSFYKNHNYHPQGNIFRSVCQEFCPQGGSTPLHTGIHPQGPEADTHFPLPLREQTPPRCSACWEIRATRGQYASY